MKTTMLVLTTAVGLAGARLPPPNARICAMRAWPERRRSASLLRRRFRQPRRLRPALSASMRRPPPPFATRGVNDSQVARAFRIRGVRRLGTRHVGCRAILWSASAARQRKPRWSPPMPRPRRRSGTGSRTSTSAYASSEALMTEYAGWRERWERFEATIPPGVTKQAMRTVIYLTDKGRG